MVVVREVECDPFSFAMDILKELHIFVPLQHVCSAVSSTNCLPNAFSELYFIFEKYVIYMTLFSIQRPSLECLHWLMFTLPKFSASNTSVTRFVSNHITHFL